MPAWSCNLVVDGYHYFLTTSGKGRNDHPPKGRAGPSHCIARVNLATGRVEYLEVPVTVIRPPGRPDEPIYGLAQRTTTLNASGQDVAQEDRSRTDGWEIPAFWGNAVAVNDRIYVTTMLGITYVIDARAPVLDANALLAINDLGPCGRDLEPEHPQLRPGPDLPPQPQGAGLHRRASRAATHAAAGGHRSKPPAPRAAAQARGVDGRRGL
jgi:hypothetical protein